MNAEKFFRVLIIGLLLCEAWAVPQAGVQAAPAPAAELPTHWDLQKIYSSLDLWEKDYRDVLAVCIPAYAAYQGRLGDANVLLAVLQLDERSSRLMDRLYLYAVLWRDEDGFNTQALQLASRAEALYIQLKTAASFIEAELLYLPDETLQIYLDDPRFTPYRHFLAFITYRKEHVLSPDEEKKLVKIEMEQAAARSAAAHIREETLIFPVILNPQGKSFQISEDTLAEALLHPQHSFRREVYEGLLEAYVPVQDTLAAAIQARVKHNVTLARLRHYDSSLAAALAGSQISEASYRRLLDEAARDAAALQRYISLRRRILKVDKVAPYDLFLPLNTPNVLPVYSYEEAADLLVKTTLPLGEDYAAEMQALLKGAYINVYPATYKSRGAYTLSAYDAPAYILLNFDGSPDSLFSLARQSGYALQDGAVNRTQPYYDSTTPLINANAAADVNQLLVLHYLLEQARNDDEKLYYLERLVDYMRGAFFMPLMYARFDLALHERVEAGQSLDAETLNRLWVDELMRFYGPDFELTANMRAGWMRLPQFYADFYICETALSTLAAVSFTQRFVKNEDDIVTDYRHFLQAGASDWPQDSLDRAGVDINTTLPLKSLLTEFDHAVNGMEIVLQ